MRRSIHASLISGTVVAVVTAIAIGGALIYGGARSNLLRQFDEEMEEDARMLVSAVKVTPEGVEIGFDELDMRDFAPGRKDYLQLWAGDAVLYRSPSLAGGDLARGEARHGRSVILWTNVAGNPRVRSLALQFRPREDTDDDELRAGDSPPASALDVPDAEMVLARATTNVDALLAKLRVLLILAGLLAGVVAAVIIAVVVRRSLRPLDQLALEISRLGGGELSSTIRLPVTPSEVEPVVDQLNDMLRRLEAAFARERTFSADIAHELRTPLAGLRSTIEVAVSRGRPAAEFRETLEESLAIVTRVQSMVETLLYLGRLEAGKVPTEMVPADVGELLGAAWEPLQEVAARRGLAVQWNPGASARVVTDPLLLELVLRNLLDNAVSYADQGGRVDVAVNGEAGSCTVRITNSGSTVAQEDVARLMDRFARADPSRSAAGHSGLGLGLVSKIAAILNCSLDIRSRAGGDFVVTLGLPARTDDG